MRKKATTMEIPESGNNELYELRDVTANMEFFQPKEFRPCRKSNCIRYKIWEIRPGTSIPTEWLECLSCHLFERVYAYQKREDE